MRKLSNTNWEAARLTTRCVEISTSKRLQKSYPNRNGEQQILDISLAPKKKKKFLIAMIVKELTLFLLIGSSTFFFFLNQKSERSSMYLTLLLIQLKKKKVERWSEIIGNG